MSSITFDAAVQWLKRNQRLFSDDLRSLSWGERAMERVRRLDRENPNWRQENYERELEIVTRMQELAQNPANRATPEELATQETATPP